MNLFLTGTDTGVGKTFTTFNARFQTENQRLGRFVTEYFVGS